MKNCLLTDFNEEIYENIDINTIQKQIDELNEKIEKFGVLYGEIYTENIEQRATFKLENITHSIKNITFIDNKIYADVEFIDTPNSKLIIEDINLFKFKLRAFGIYNNITTLNYIITWDIFKI